MTIQDYIEKFHQNAISKGFYERPTKPTERFQLMISEVSEATEEFRNKTEDFYLVNGKPEGQAVELVDVLIRIFDFAGYKEINFVKFIETHFFMKFGDIVSFTDLLNEVKDLKNIKCYNELESLVDDLEYHLSINISLANAGDAYLKNKEDEKIFLHLSEAVVKIAYIFSLKNWNLEEIINIKHEYNVNRPYKHGGKVC